MSRTVVGQRRGCPAREGDPREPRSAVACRQPDRQTRTVLGCPNPRGPGGLAGRLPRGSSRRGCFRHRPARGLRGQPRPRAGLRVPEQDRPARAARRRRLVGDRARRHAQRADGRAAVRDRRRAARHGRAGLRGHRDARRRRGPHVDGVLDAQAGENDRRRAAHPGRRCGRRRRRDGARAGGVRRGRARGLRERAVPVRLRRRRRARADGRRRRARPCGRGRARDRLLPRLGQARPAPLLPRHRPARDRLRRLPDRRRPARARRGRRRRGASSSPARCSRCCSRASAAGCTCAAHARRRRRLHRPHPRAAPAKRPSLVVRDRSAGPCERTPLPALILGSAIVGRDCAFPVASRPRRVATIAAPQRRDPALQAGSRTMGAAGFEGTSSTATSSAGTARPIPPRPPSPARSSSPAGTSSPATSRSSRAPRAPPTLPRQAPPFVWPSASRWSSSGTTEARARPLPR